MGQTEHALLKYAFLTYLLRRPCLDATEGKGGTHFNFNPGFSVFFFFVG